MVILLGLLVGAVYAPEIRGMTRQWWEDPNYSHGFLVPIFSAFLLWRRRHALANLRAQGSWIGLLILVTGVGIFLLSEIAAELFTARSSLIIVLAGLVVLHLGWAGLRLVLFPLIFLMFMIPLPAIALNEVSLPLQRLSSQFAASTLQALGRPVVLDGNLIHLPGLTLGVTEACSGIRSLISLLTLATAWAYMRFHRAGAITAAIVAAVPSAILANTGRIVITGMVGTWLGPAYAQGVFHELSGVVIFAVAIACLLGTSVAIGYLMDGNRRSPAVVR